jgi:SAM-dependent methyltransferase
LSRASAAPGTPLVTGADYVVQITARASDRRARAAFQHLVGQLLPAPARIFDFGCGTGIDARHYAQAGYCVQAYDVDQAMCDYFSRHCAELLAAGSICLLRGAYRDFLTRSHPRAARVALVTANFAPLNLIADLPALFAALHGLTAPGGRVLASMLNPYYCGDARYGWWWRNLPALLQRGQYAVPGAQADIQRRGLKNLAAQCAPYFTLERVFAGSARDTAARQRGFVPGRASWRHLLACRFMFLLFARCDHGDD